MLELEQVDGVVVKAASAVLGMHGIKAVSALAADSGGDDALHVSIILPEASLSAVTGDNALDTIVRVRQDLQAAGDQRFPIIDFVGGDEWVLDGDSAS